MSVQLYIYLLFFLVLTKISINLLLVTTEEKKNTEYFIPPSLRVSGY